MYFIQLLTILMWIWIINMSIEGHFISVKHQISMVSRYFTTLFHELQQKYVWFYISGCGEGISGCGERIIRRRTVFRPEKDPAVLTTR